MSQAYNDDKLEDAYRLSVFAAFGVLLTMVGVYGVTAFVVQHRQPE